MDVGEDDLVRAAIAGDLAAFSLLVRRDRPRVQAVTKQLVGAEAEDVVQEALLRAYLSLSQLRDPSRFTAWLCGIAVNLAKMRLRRRITEMPLTADAAADDRSDEQELVLRLREAIDVLPPAQRDAVLLHYIDGLPCVEVAHLLRTSPGAVRVRLHRARQLLREQLAGEFSPSQVREQIKMPNVRIADVLVRVNDDQPLHPVSDLRIVLLSENEKGRTLPIWIGSAEGDPLALRLTGEAAPRPLTSDLLAEVIRATGAQVEQISITSVHEKTFYASITLNSGEERRELDARPSDALNLAVRVAAPITVDEHVLDEHGLPEDEIAANLAKKEQELVGDLPSGRWESVSAELLRMLYPVP
jgi:RNA polymerase sigma factor (sigma-70 family)